MTGCHLPTMSLSLYRKKRSFTKTTEPEGGRNTGDDLRFVVQKHAASHLHYDFRLEMEGVLKSWAVPKGPSLDPDVKRLAMMVEDHPFDYRHFEGTIPEGNYGAGTVIVWDEGTYEPADPEGQGKKSFEKQLLADLKKKRLKILLHGKKLQGEFALVKTGMGAENAWLLMKLNDRHATKSDITLADKSVVSRKTLEQVEKAGRVASPKKSPGKKPVARKTAVRKAAPKKAAAKNAIAGKKKVPEARKSKTKIEHLEGLLEQAPQSSFPKPFKPMLATRVAEAFDGPEWLYEIKWDGYRAVAYVRKNKTGIYSRNLLSFERKFPTVVQALQELPDEMVLDGEIVALDENDKPSFQLLQNHAGADTQFAYYVFDLPWYKGRNLKGLPLSDRKSILQSVIPRDHPVIRYSSHIAETGKDFFSVAVEHGLEGVMAKKADSSYTIGHRSGEWLKIKNDQRMEAIICGFTRPRNSRSYFGAVILGQYKGDVLEYIGHSGSGFSEQLLEKLHKIFRPLITGKCPFAKKPKTNSPVTWLRPQLVCEVKFTEWTSDNMLRHPIFLGLREDKNAITEKNEKVVKAPVVKKSLAGKTRPVSVKQTETVKKISSRKKPQATGKSRSLAAEKIPEGNKEETITVKGHSLKLTNLTKLYWPKEKITKRDLLNYYAAIAPYIMPYMKDRPQSMNRHPDGIEKGNFFHKNLSEHAPEWIDTFPYTSDAGKEPTNYLICRSEADLLYMASQGCIEMNPWHSRVPRVDKPDWCVIDLDPDTNTFNKVIETALVVKNVLDSVGVDSYCKTSGSTGLHIYIPLGARYTYDQSRMLAQWVVQMVHDELPSFTSIERSPSKRKGKIYLDYLQNKSTQTIAAPYSLRPKPGATVSTPLYWDEVTKGLRMKDHSIYTIQDRLKTTGDIFKPVLGKGIELKKVLQRIESLSE